MTLGDALNVPAGDWTNLLFIAPATGTNTVLELGFRDDPGYLGLDDISVFPIDRPWLGPCYANGVCAFSWTGIAGVSYQAQYVTNLEQTNWINLGAPLPGNNATLTISDLVSTNQQRFYRILLSP